MKFFWMLVDRKERRVICNTKNVVMEKNGDRAKTAASSRTPITKDLSEGAAKIDGLGRIGESQRRINNDRYLAFVNRS